MTAAIEAALADPQQTIAELRRQLDECRAELAARNSEYGERIAHQSATVDVLKVMSASPGVFDLITRHTRELCNANAAALYGFDGDLIHLLSVADPRDTVSAAYRRQFPMAPTRGSAFGRAILERQIVHIRDVDTDPEVAQFVRDLGVRSIAALPLLRDGMVIGAVALNTMQPGGLSDSQVELLKTFAEQVVITIASAETYRELRQRTGDLQESLEYQTATSDVLKVISRSTFDLQPVLETLIETAARLCGAEAGHLFRRESEGFRRAASFGLLPELHSFLTSKRSELYGANRGSIVGRVALEGGVVHVHDAASDPDYSQAEAVALGKLRSGLGVPLLREDELIGVITLGRRRIEPFTERQIELVRTFADQAVIAIENTRLLSETREALEQQTATAEVLQVINSSPGDLAPVFDAILEKAHSLCGAAHGVLVLRDGENFRAVGARGLPDRFAERLRSGFPSAGNPVAEPLLAGAPLVQLADVSRIDHPVSQAGASAGLRTLMAVALRKEGALLGWIVAARREVRAFSDKEIALLQNFAAQAVIAMENARLLTETREALEQQTATAEVLQVINSSPGDLAPVFDAILEKAHSLCGAAHGVLVSYDGEHACAVAIRGMTEPLAGLLRQPFRPLPNSPHARLIREQRVIHIPDLATEALWEPDDPKRIATAEGGVRTLLFVPLRKDDVVLGWIAANRLEMRPFSDKEIALLESFAAQAVIAMENARLLGELRERTSDLEESLEYQTATSDVLQVISRSTFELQPVLDTLVETATRLCDAQMGHLAIREDQDYRYVATRSVSPEWDEIARDRSVRPGRGTVLGRTALEGRVIHIADVAIDPEYTWPEAVTIGRVRTALGVRWCARANR
jgi:GAF domain-containing protein